MRNGWPPDPIAVIRKLERQNGNLVEIFYRAVTWAPDSLDRELIGYYPTGMKLRRRRGSIGAATTNCASTTDGDPSIGSAP